MGNIAKVILVFIVIATGCLFAQTTHRRWLIAPVPAAWKYTDIPNLFFWFDSTKQGFVSSNSVYTNGAFVSNVVNIAGTCTGWTFASQFPIQWWSNGTGTNVFLAITNGTTKGMNIRGLGDDALMAQPFTYFIVSLCFTNVILDGFTGPFWLGGNESVPSQDYLLKISPSDYFLKIATMTDTVNMLGASNAITDQTPFLLMVQLNGESSFIRKNGVNYLSFTNTVTTDIMWSIMQHASVASSRFLYGYFYRAMCWKRNLTMSEITNVENHLMYDYGMITNLP